MKNLCNTILVLLLVQTFSFAQEDSVLYITPLEEAFMIDKETKSLFKIEPFISNYGGLRNDGDIGELMTVALAFEQKIGNAFSIAPNVDFSRTYCSIFLGLGGEFRYYYKLPKLIKEQKQANNLSSNYFALSYNKRTRPSILKQSFLFGITAIELTYGVQKRFMNYGYLDFRVNFGRQREHYFNQSNFYISTETNIGIGLGKNYKYSETSKCPIFKCFSNRKSAVKINLNKIWSFSANDVDHITVSLNPNIIHEIKILNSPVSFEQDLDILTSFSNWLSSESAVGGVDKNTFGVNVFGLKYRAGFKYYHSMKSRIRNGKSGNNLSGFYIFGRGEYEVIKTFSQLYEYNGTSFPPDKEVDQSVQLGYGYQKEVLEKLFFDINFGLFLLTNKYKKFDYKWGGVADMKVGIMF